MVTDESRLGRAGSSWKKLIRPTREALASFPPAMPRLIGIRMESPVDLAVLLSSAFAAGGGVVAVVLRTIERVFTIDVQIKARRAELKAEAAMWERRRTEDELRILDLAADHNRVDASACRN
jgi:hypothetical protein